MVYKSLDFCGFLIRLENNDLLKVDESSLPNMVFNDGQKVKFGYTIITSGDTSSTYSYCQAGIKNYIHIDCIEPQ